MSRWRTTKLAPIVTVESAHSVDTSSTVNVLSIAAGAGGLDQGVKLAIPRARTVCYIENEITACAILAARMEKGSLDQAPIWTDARTFNGEPWRGIVDLIVAGYPCQPFSNAGNERGFEDPRNLWPTVLDLVSTIRPSAILLENVAGHVRNGYVNIVEPDLQSASFKHTQAILVTTSAIGAYHKRTRLFSLALADSGGDRWAQFLIEQEAITESVYELEQDASILFAVSGANDGRREDLVSMEALRATHRSDTGMVWLPDPTNVEKWRQIIRGTGDSFVPFLPESRLRGDTNGSSAGHNLRTADRLRILGNGVIPAQAALALRALLVNRWD